MNNDYAGHVRIPVWFAKMLGVLVGVFGLGFISWHAWMTIALVTHQDRIEVIDKRCDTITTLDKELDGALRRIAVIEHELKLPVRTEDDRTPQTQLPIPFQPKPLGKGP